MKIKDFLKNVALFADLDDADLTKVAKQFTLRSYPRNSIIFLETEPGEQFYVVLTGTVRVYRIAEDGREMVLDIFTAGDYFGEMALLDGYLRSATAQTREPTQVLVMSGDNFHSLVRERPTIALTIIITLCWRLRQANVQIEDLVFRNARERIIRAIIRLASIGGMTCQEGVRIDLRVTHQELGAMSGTSRETVTRIIQELQEKNMVRTGRYHLIITDLIELEKYILPTE